MRLVTWNLFHGRADPPAGRDLLREFAATLAGWEWDVALLQEVPPWWPGPLAEAAGAQQRHVLTSRNFGLALRQWVALRRPDFIRSNGGGCNALLVRGASIVEHRVQRLRWLPERRWMHGVRLPESGWVVNVHATVPADDVEQRDLAKARETALRWAGEERLVLGGDVNQRRPRVPDLQHVAANHVDHLFVRGWEPAGEPRLLQRGRLSDHAPLALELRSTD